MSEYRLQVVNLIFCVLITRAKARIIVSVGVFFCARHILSPAVLSQSGEISPDFCRLYGGGIRHDEDIMHSFQNFIVRLIPNHPPPLETRIRKLVVRALLTGPL